MNGLKVSRLSLVTIFLILRLMLQQLLLAFRIEHGAVSFFFSSHMWTDTISQLE
jgi:hypothetical protein